MGCGERVLGRSETGRNRLEKREGEEGGKKGNGKKNVQTMFGQGVMFV